MLRACIALLALVGAVVLGGCGDITYQTRYLPKASQLSWDEEVEQLPWREPALDGRHYTRNGRPDQPMFKDDLHVDTAWPMQAQNHSAAHPD